MNSGLTCTELGESDIFDPLSLSASAPFTQSPTYKTWQTNLGRKVSRFVIKKNARLIGFFQVIHFNLPFGKSFLYCPYGPLLTEISEEIVGGLKKFLMETYRDCGVVFIKLDFSVEQMALEKNAGVFEKFFKKSPKIMHRSAYVQPRAEWYLDITDSNETIIKRCHEKTRYLIRLSERKGVTSEIIEKDFSKHFEQFYTLLSGTAQRNGFSLHPKEYYRNIFNSLDLGKNSAETNNTAFLSVTKFEDEILVMNLIVRFGDTAHFIFGGSSDTQRNLSPSHLAQWSAICHAQKIGCTKYNFGGIETNDGTHKNWEGLSSFKRKFGGYEVAHNHCYDIIIEKPWYFIYILRKNIRTSSLHPRFCRHFFHSTIKGINRAFINNKKQ